MNQTVRELYIDVRDFHHKLLRVLPEIEQEIKSGSDEKEMADLAYAMREIARLCDDARKRCEQKKRLAEQLACALTIAVTQSAEPIRTEFCRASPKMRSIVSVPRRSKEPEKYAELMKYLGVPEHLWQGGEHAVVNTHWPGLMDLLAAKQERGEPLPPGIDPNKTYPEYTLVIHGYQSPAGGAVEDDDGVLTEEVPF